MAVIYCWLTLRTIKSSRSSKSSKRFKELPQRTYPKVYAHERIRALYLLPYVRMVVTWIDQASCVSRRLSPRSSLRIYRTDLSLLCRAAVILGPHQDLEKWVSTDVLSGVESPEGRKGQETGPAGPGI
eukprot:1376200-Amorphochlora_amoeboformis.AAC.1